MPIENPRKYKYCAECHKELGEEYFTFRDNFLQVKFFEELDGSDNAFCDEHCACIALSGETLDNVDDDSDLHMCVQCGDEIDIEDMIYGMCDDCRG